MELGLASVAAITALCYLAGLVVKVTPWSNNQYIPIVCGVSGLAATGANQVKKQLNQ